MKELLLAINMYLEQLEKYLIRFMYMQTCVPNDEPPLIDQLLVEEAQKSKAY